MLNMVKPPSFGQFKPPIPHLWTATAHVVLTTSTAARPRDDCALVMTCAEEWKIYRDFYMDL
jgi:hypothetical protein